MATYLSYAMDVRRKLSMLAKTVKKYTWETHPVYGMDLLCVSIFTSILGAVTDEKEMSVKAKWLRKKYMGVWRWESSLMSRMMSRFPSTVVRYMARNGAEYMSWSSARMGSPRRMNSDTVLSLSLLIFLIFCCELKSKWGKNKIWFCLQYCQNILWITRTKNISQVHLVHQF